MGPETNSQKGLEVLELRLVRVVEMRRGIVHVGGEPITQLLDGLAGAFRPVAEDLHEVDLHHDVADVE